MNLQSKLALVLMVLLITGVNAFSQKTKIFGSVIDGGNNETIPYATISLLDAQDNVVEGAVSDNTGQFEISDLPFGTYRVEVSFIGYVANSIENVDLTKDKRHVNLGNVVLNPGNVNLEEVSVTGSTNTVTGKIDRKRYSAQDFKTAQGGTAVDILNKLPSVSVDPDGNVSVRGTSDFMVYLNGKPTQMEPSMLLGQISGNTIENIEVITVPTAKYDADGKGGIINITTKRKGLEGLSISENLMLGGSPWGNDVDKYSGYEQNDNRLGSGFNLMWRKNELALFAGYNMNNKNVNGMRTGDARILIDEDSGLYKHMVAAGERPEWYRYWSANAGFEYEIKPSTSISGAYFYGKRREGRSAFYVYNVFYADKDKQAISGFDRNESWIYNPNTDNRYGTFQSANIDLKHDFSDVSNLSVSLLYESSGLSRKLENQNYNFDYANDQVLDKTLHYIQTDDTPLEGFRASVDYSTKLNRGQTLSLGFQPQVFDIAGGFGYDTLGVVSGSWAPFSSLENTVDLRRAIYAGYIDYRGNYGKLEYIAGLRMEFTDQEMDILDPDYFSIFDGEKQSQYMVDQLDWFPTLHLDYPVNENNRINFAASRRINRPPLKNMAPFLYRRHLEVYVVGDPELEPEYINNMEMSYERKFGRQTLSLTGFYRGTENAVFRVNTITNENQSVLDVVQEEVLIRSYTNAGNTQALGAELNANLVAGERIKFFLGGSLYQFEVDSDIFGYQSLNESMNWSLKANLNWRILDELTFTTDFDIKSATVTAQGQNDLFFVSNAAFNYSPAKVKGLECSVRVLDVLVSNVQGLDTRAYNSAGAEIFYQETEYHRFGPIVELGISYSLNTKGKLNKSGDNSFGQKQF